MLMTARRLRADQSGFSLVELLVAMALGSIVLTALMTVFMNGVTGAVQTSDRVDALQRGRITMDRVVTLLNSQLCLLNPDGTGQPPILDGQSTQVTFYATLGAVDSNPTIYRLRYDSGTKRLYEDQFLPVPSGNAVTYPTYPALPNSSRVIGTNILPVTSGAPIFKYWQFITTAGPTLGMVDTTPLSPPLTSTTEFAAVRTTITFVSQPEHTTGSANDLRATTFVDGVATVGSANAGEPAKGVNC
jgi:prepilin-type N-terminal cleavage/methylation domain-containing protein